MDISKSVFFLLVLLSIAYCNDDLSQYQFNATLVQNKYWLYWSFNKSSETIAFAVKVKTTGWVGFGISPNGQMPGSDIVIGWIDQTTPYFQVIFTITITNITHIY